MESMESQIQLIHKGNFWEKLREMEFKKNLVLVPKHWNPMHIFLIIHSLHQLDYADVKKKNAPVTARVPNRFPPRWPS